VFSLVRKLAYVVFAGAFGVLASDRIIKGYEVKGGYSLLLWIALGVSALVLLLSAEPVYTRLPGFLRLSDFKVKIENDHWEDFHHEALIVELKVRVKNRTRHEKQIKDVIFKVAGGGLTLPYNADLMREVHSGGIRYRALPGTVDPRESVYGWYRHSVASQLEGGSPAYRVTVCDELGNEYSDSKKARPARRKDPGSLQ